jgi:hypothetical protein
MCCQEDKTTFIYDAAFGVGIRFANGEVRFAPPTIACMNTLAPLEHEAGDLNGGDCCPDCGREDDHRWIAESAGGRCRDCCGTCRIGRLK